MNPRLMVGIAAIVGTAACGLSSAIANMEIAEEVNSRLPKDAQFSPMGWYLSKHYVSTASTNGSSRPELF
jgi:hypothetical protein